MMVQEWCKNSGTKTKPNQVKEKRGERLRTTALVLKGGPQDFTGCNLTPTYVIALYKELVCK